MSERNGSIARWILNGLFTSVLLGVGWWVNSNAERLDTLEQGRLANATNIAATRYEISAMHRDLCIALDEIYDIREELTKKRVFRRPCP